MIRFFHKEAFLTKSGMISTWSGINLTRVAANQPSLVIIGSTQELVK